MTALLNELHSTTRPSRIEVTRHAVLRTSCLALAEPAGAARRYAELAETLVTLLRSIAGLAPAAEQQLYDVAAASAPEVRSRVIIPLRRDIHNGRLPNERVARAAPELGLSEVSRWLELRAALTDRAAELDSCRDEALADSRRALARLCLDESFRRACALTSEELLRAVTKYALSDGVPDRRSVKSESTVLRHALRAAVKTVPLGWFASASWGTADGGPKPAATVALSRPDLASVYDVVADVIGELPADLRPLRVTPGSYRDANRLWFRRRPAGATRDELAAVPLSGALERVLGLVDAATPGTATIRAIAGALAVDPARIAPTVTQLVDAGILRHDDVVDPQSESPLTDAATWAAGVGHTATAGALSELADQTRAWSHVPAVDRPRRMADLQAGWRALLPAGTPTREPLREDVTSRSMTPVALGGTPSDVAALTPLFEVFDWFTELRRQQRHRFVATFGEGGRCASLGEYAEQYSRLWRPQAEPADAAIENDPVLQAIRILQNQVRAGIRPGVEADELVLGDECLPTTEQLPSAVTARPTSFSVFAQHGAQGATVNQIYGGWGRFTSRFLHGLAPQARDAVRATILRNLDGPVAQVRPVQNFSANLHPLIVDDEIAERAGRGTIALQDLQIVHDRATDAIRICRRVNGELINVLYLGFLVPMVLPAHLGALTNDLGSGLIDFSSLIAAHSVPTDFGPVSVRPRLRYRSIVLARRSWTIGAAPLAMLRQRLTESPEQAIAMLRAHTGLPRHLFLGAGAAGPAATNDGAGTFVARMGRPRSQYVDLGDALHVRQLAKLLSRYPDGVCFEEAWPIPEPGRPATEFVIETYRPAKEL